VGRGERGLDQILDSVGFAGQQQRQTVQPIQVRQHLTLEAGRQAGMLFTTS
jgi:hypothetical protein